MCDRARGFAKVGDQLGDLARECFGLGRPIERLAELGGGDQLHRASDLANVLDRLAALDDRSGLGHQLHRGGDPCLQAWGGAASFQERKLSKRNRRVSRRGRTNDRKMPTNGRAGPRILSSGLRGRLRRAHARSVGRPVVGLGAASSGPDWRSIRDVLSVARFASALVSRHQSPLVNAYVVIALTQAVAFRRRSLTPWARSFVSFIAFGSRANPSGSARFGFPRSAPRSSHPPYRWRHPGLHCGSRPVQVAEKRTRTIPAEYGIALASVDPPASGRQSRSRYALSRNQLFASAKPRGVISGELLLAPLPRIRLAACRELKPTRTLHDVLYRCCSFFGAKGLILS